MAPDLAAFVELYERIHMCERCYGDPGCRMDPERDREQVLRQPIEESLNSDLFIVGLGLARSTQRLSGFPYRLKDGKLSRTGEVLGDFLARFGYAIRPGSDLPVAYSTDLVQRWPGPGSGGGDRRPTRQEVANCADWFDVELRLVRPSVALLLGGDSAKHFLGRYGGGQKPAWGEGHDVVVDGGHITAVPVQHPAYRRRKPQEVDAVYERAAGVIRFALSSRSARQQLGVKHDRALDA